jgi:hypothetical protein
MSPSDFPDRNAKVNGNFDTLFAKAPGSRPNRTSAHLVELLHKAIDVRDGLAHHPFVVVWIAGRV